MKVCVITFGCAFNKADSKKIEEILFKKNIELVDENKAELLIINTCGVKRATHNRIINYLKGLKKKAIITGCLVKILRLQGLNKNLVIAKEISEIDKLLKKEKSKKIKKLKEDIGIIQISQGCLNNCNYCATKIARGNLKSKTISEILGEIDSKIKNGCQEIYLTAQDTGCYGFDIKTSLSELLEQILKEFNSLNVKFRLGMANPTYLKKNLGVIIKALNSSLFMKFLHIPVQTGSNKVLKEMGRDYKVKDFVEIVSQVRNKVKDVSVATDIIVGYPTETEKDFLETVNLLKKLKIEVVNVSKYSKMPGTVAGAMKQLSSQDIKRRSVVLHKLIKEYKK